MLNLLKLFVVIYKKIKTFYWRKNFFEQKTQKNAVFVVSNFLINFE